MVHVDTSHLTTSILIHHKGIPAMVAHAEPLHLLWIISTLLHLALLVGHHATISCRRHLRLHLTRHDVVVPAGQ